MLAIPLMASPRHLTRCEVRVIFEREAKRPATPAGPKLGPQHGLVDGVQAMVITKAVFQLTRNQ